MCWPPARRAVVREMVGTFEKESGHKLKITYAPVGALRDKITRRNRRISPSSPRPSSSSFRPGLVRPVTRTDLGQVGGGIAVRKGNPRPAIGRRRS